MKQILFGLVIGVLFGMLIYHGSFSATKQQRAFLDGMEIATKLRACHENLPYGIDQAYFRRVALRNV